MEFYDRLTGQFQKSMPEEQHMVVGRWQLILKNDDAIKINGAVPPEPRVYILPNLKKIFTLQQEKGLKQELVFPEWQMPSSFLLESFHYFEETFKKVFEGDNNWQDWVNTLPLVHNIEENISPQPLEKLLEEHMGHLEEICHRPRSYLKMETDRLPISRAQRISPHAAEFLSAHTEDWESKTFRSIRPKKVLCLVREDLINIYENVVAARLIDNLLEYLYWRICQVKIIERELQEADDFSKDIQGQNKIYWKNRDRIYSLWGEQFKAESSLKKARETLSLLNYLQYKLRGLLETELYQAIPKRATVGNTLKKTNILVNDQHYRYLDRLWRYWTNWKRRQTLTPQKMLEIYQKAFKGFEAFCFLIISRAITGNSQLNDMGLGFSIDKFNDKSLEFNSFKGQLELIIQKDGSFILKFNGIIDLKFIPFILPLTAAEKLEEISEIYKKLSSVLSKASSGMTIVLYLGSEDEYHKLFQLRQQNVNGLGNDYSQANNSICFLPVNPSDIFSVERVARVIQWWLHSKYFELYPFIFQERIPEELLDKNSWLIKERRGYIVCKPPEQDEEDRFNTNLLKLINQSRSLGSRAKGQLIELQQIENFCQQVQQKFIPLLICPTCYQLTNNRFDPSLDSQCFNCYCNNLGCNTQWGTKKCGNCGERYPYILLQNFEIDESIQQQGWVERVFGRNVLAIPNFENRFICSSCGEIS